MGSNACVQVTRVMCCSAEDEDGDLLYVVLELHRLRISSD